MTETTNQPPLRAEHIGSLLRPSELVEATNRYLIGAISGEELSALQDRAVDEAIRFQESLGLKCVTDGEMRRLSYLDKFYRNGFGIRIMPKHSEDPLQIQEKIRWTAPVHVDEFVYLKARTAVLPKMTLVGPTRVHMRSGREHISRDAYPDLDCFWDDLVTAVRSEVAALASAGCTYIQIDDTAMAKFGDAPTQRALADRGEPWNKLLPLYIDVLNRVVADPPPGVKFGFHLCRGNSTKHADGFILPSGGYENIAEHLFNELRIEIFFLEYDSPRAGSFEPLKHMPRGKRAVLGLVSTKTPEVESEAELYRRIEEAARYIDIDQLAISPQCGFSGVFKGHPLTFEQQAAKLRRVVEIADKVWGTT